MVNTMHALVEVKYMVSWRVYEFALSPSVCKTLATLHLVLPSTSASKKCLKQSEAKMEIRSDFRGTVPVTNRKWSERATSWDKQRGGNAQY